MTTLSIIIPVYNAVDYLLFSVDSALNQTYADIEVILVDDGSTDDSALICDELVARDDRVRVLHTPNFGVSAARNTGISIATGEFIAFLDADDLLDTQAIEKMMYAMETYDVDIVVSKLYRFGENGNKMNAMEIAGGFWNKEQITCQLIKDRIGIIDKGIAMNQIYWCGFTSCLYQKKILNDNCITFPAQRFGEDTLFLVHYLLSCNTAYVINEELYGYRQHIDSVMHRYIKNYLDDILSQKANWYHLFESQHDAEVNRRLRAKFASKYTEAMANELKNPLLVTHNSRSILIDRAVYAILADEMSRIFWCADFKDLLMYGRASRVFLLWLMSRTRLGFSLGLYILLAWDRL